MKGKVWLIVVVILLGVIGYGGLKYLQYSREWEQFETAWLKVEAGLTGDHSYSWRPGLFSAVGEVDISECGVTDEKLAHFKGVTTLVRLDLSENDDVTDAGAAQLVELPGLLELDLRGTQVSDDAVRRLQEAAGGLAAL